MGRSDVAIIIPAFNEEKSIENIVTSCSKYGKVIVINDGSNDKTSYKATKAGSLVLNHSKKKGYDAALNTGFSYAFQKKYKFFITLDADGQHDPSYLPLFINEIESESGFEITDSDGNLSITKNIYLNFIELSNQVVDVPEIFDFRQNYPNPFNPITEISFDLPIGVNVDIDIYNIKGNKVHDLIKDIYFNAGRHNITWNASNHPGGIYFYRITAGEFSKTHKMILLK